MIGHAGRKRVLEQAVCRHMCSAVPAVGPMCPCRHLNSSTHTHAPAVGALQVLDVHLSSLPLAPEAVRVAVGLRDLGGCCCVRLVHLGDLRTHARTRGWMGACIGGARRGRGAAQAHTRVRKPRPGTLSPCAAASQIHTKYIPCKYFVLTVADCFGPTVGWELLKPSAIKKSSWGDLQVERTKFAAALASRGAPWRRPSVARSDALLRAGKLCERREP